MHTTRTRLGHGLLTGVLLLAALGCVARSTGEVAGSPPPTGDTAAAPGAPAAADPPVMPARATTAGFSVPIPPGYTRMPDAQLEELQARRGAAAPPVAMLLSKPRAAPDHFLTTIVVVSVGEVDLDPVAACDEIARYVAARAGAEAEPPKLVRYPFGSTCQFEMGDERQQAVQTLVYLGRRYWTVTCNFDRRDDASRSECELVLQGFAAAP